MSRKNRWRLFTDYSFHNLPEIFTLVLYEHSVHEKEYVLPMLDNYQSDETPSRSRELRACSVWPTREIFSRNGIFNVQSSHNSYRSQLNLGNAGARSLYFGDSENSKQSQSQPYKTKWSIPFIIAVQLLCNRHFYVHQGSQSIEIDIRNQSKLVTIELPD